MNKHTWSKVASLALFASFSVAYAHGYTDVFPSSGSTVVGSVGVIGANEIGYFWSVGRGDKVEESFSTGYSAVIGLTLDFDVVANFLASGAFTNWDVRINGTTVGSWTHTGTSGVGHQFLTYSFSPISDGGGNYLVGMYVTNEVAGGDGSISLSKDLRTDSMTLTPVPEPASMAALGLGALAMIRRRRAK
jgi:hypothetical protein